LSRVERKGSLSDHSKAAFFLNRGFFLYRGYYTKNVDQRVASPARLNTATMDV
jgi:hypothetical protein